MICPDAFGTYCIFKCSFDIFQVHNILAEMVMGGMVLETNMNEIVTQIDAQNKLEKSEVRVMPCVVSKLKNMFAVNACYLMLFVLQ